MVHIKRVEIFGFKSFGFKNTIVDLHPGMVTISGPNGSGKSNILNAIIFAMGENRARIMGADKLRSLIHAVEGSNRGVKMARSSIHFDNADRRIPVSADIVEITREMDNKGDNTYYVNKKKTQRTNIINLLDAANAGLNQFNALQQGTVTRISDSSPEEKRMAIEDLVGLSYFDDKKEESKKQLTEADHRLEISMTRMDEVKKNIDDLEEARNIYLRHKNLEVEITRLNVIDAVRNLKSVTSQITEKESVSKELSEQMRQKRAARDELRIDIQKITSEKEEFLKDADAYNHAKAEMESNIGELIRKSKEADAVVGISTHRIEQIITRIPEIEHELRTGSKDRETILEESSSLRTMLEKNNVRKNEIGEKLQVNNSHLTDILNRHAQIVTYLKSIDTQTKKMNEDKSRAALVATKLETEISGNDARFTSNHSKRVAIDAYTTNLKGMYARLERVIIGYNRSKTSLQSRMDLLASKKTQIQKEIDDINEILEKSQNATSQYKAKLKMIRDIMHEDYSIAQLKEHAYEIGIVGYAYELLSWDSQYERAALAAGSEWLKAVVTVDIATMISLSEYVRSKNLSKLKIISLGNLVKDTETDTRLDMLADHIKCKNEHKSLVSFLFGDIVIAKSAQDARKLAESGHRAVTLDGELVESGSRATIIDMNSKISKLTRLIANAATLDGLGQSILLLKDYLGKKRAARQRADVALHRSRDKLANSESNITTSQSELERLVVTIDNSQKSIQRLDEQNAIIAKRKEYAVHEIERLKSILKDLDGQIANVETGVNNADDAKVLDERKLLDQLKIELELENEKVLSEYGDISLKLSKIESGLDRSTERASRLEAERSRLLKERTTLGIKIEEQHVEQERSSQELVAVRQQEQDIISTRGESVSQIGQYDSQLDELRGREKTIDREIGTATRNDDSLRRDLAELIARQTSLRRICSTHDVGNDIEDIDVRRLLSSLRTEFETVTNLNTAAPAKYLEISTGYRSMSDKKNSLESERNKIIKFIDDIEKDKRQKFLDAFSIVDAEVRHVFSKMTGGNARLELEDEDDIFNSGISYTIQFPNKLKRESTGISGGEKSLAAIVFVLALQKLNPSPFYLFDEVDAHLDGPNSEKLVKILKERAQDSQFIVVSLKDSIIKKADLVYGVYPKAGVSQVLVYKDKHVPKISN